jgi:hypothetical protein
LSVFRVIPHKQIPNCASCIGAAAVLGGFQSPSVVGGSGGNGG